MLEGQPDYQHRGGSADIQRRRRENDGGDFLTVGNHCHFLTHEVVEATP